MLKEWYKTETDSWTSKKWKQKSKKIQYYKKREKKGWKWKEEIWELQKKEWSWKRRKNEVEREWRIMQNGWIEIGWYKRENKIMEYMMEL